MPGELLDKEDEINIISDDTIVNLKKLILTTIKEDEVTEYIYWHCQKVILE